jgi:hypothetical protein
LDWEAKGTDRDLAIVVDAHRGLLAKDIRPPGASWDGAQGGAVLLEGEVASCLGGHTQFAMHFMGIGMGQELVQQVIGPFQFDQVFGGKESWQAALVVEGRPLCWK